MSNNKLPCTGCGICAAQCPVKINIPAYLNLYNNTIESEKLPSVDIPGGKPSDCIGCGSCRALCPLSINTPYYMEVLEKK